MRTTSSSHGKGEEPIRRFADDLRLLRDMCAKGLDYLVTGRKIRKMFNARQRAGAKLYIDEEDL